MRRFYDVVSLFSPPEVKVPKPPPPEDDARKEAEAEQEAMRKNRQRLAGAQGASSTLLVGLGDGRGSVGQPGVGGSSILGSG